MRQVSDKRIAAFLAKVSPRRVWDAIPIHDRIGLLHGAPRNLVGGWIPEAGAREGAPRWVREDVWTGQEVAIVSKLRRGRKWNVEIIGYGVSKKKFIQENDAKAWADELLRTKMKRVFE